MKLRHIILGTAGWLGALGSGYLATQTQMKNQSSSVSELAADVRQWVLGEHKSDVAESAVPLYIALDDPIFVSTADGQFTQTGYVSSIDGSRDRDPIAVKRVQIFVYDKAVRKFPDGYCLEYCTTPMNLDWVVRMMIPESRRYEIAELIRTEWDARQQVIMEQLQPLLKESLRLAINAVRAELPTIIDIHRDEFRHLGDRFEAEILQEDLVPLIRDEIFPVIQEETRPLVQEIGKSLWNRVSLLSFTWRYLYDVSPLPSRNAVRTEFQRFIAREAVPELQKHMDDFVEVTNVVIKRVIENERVRSTVGNSIQHVVEDPEFQRILVDIVGESTIYNTTLRHDIQDYWNSADARATVRVASNRFENMVRTIGDLIFGTRKNGITPEFSRVLRSQVLKKDRRWFLMVPRDSSTPAETVRITVHREPMLYPLKFAGEHQSPLTPESRPPDGISPRQTEHRIMAP